MTHLASSAIEGLKGGIRGQVLQQNDPGYEEARRIWNAMIDRRPALIVRCAGVADVRRAVNFARETNLLLAVRALPSPQCEIFFGQIGGQTCRVPIDATAYCARDTKYVMNVHARWENASEDTRCVEWARAFFEASAPFALGSVYVNFLTQDESARIGAAYGPNYERLVAVKTRYDPSNLFRHNQNIKPSAS